MRRILVVLGAGLLLSGAVSAQAIYKCVEPGKPVSYQSEPCSRAARTDAVRPYTPEPEPTAEERRARALLEQKARRESEYLSRLAGTSRAGSGNGAAQGASIQTRPRSPGACEAARAARDAHVGRNNQGGSYESRQALNDAVARHCH